MERMDRFNQISSEINAEQHVIVSISPKNFISNRLGPVASLLAKANSVSVSLRGWDFPYISHRPEEQVAGRDWVGGYSDFMSHLETWRIFQSGLYQYKSVVREYAEEDQEQLMKSLFESDGVRFSFELISQLYFLTEVFEFGHRMAVSFNYEEGLNLAIRYPRTIDTVIGNTDIGRKWHGSDRCIFPHIDLNVEMSYVDAVSKYRHKLLEATQDFFLVFSRRKCC